MKKINKLNSFLILLGCISLVYVFIYYLVLVKYPAHTNFAYDFGLIFKDLSVGFSGGILVYMLTAGIPSQMREAKKNRHISCRFNDLVNTFRSFINQGLFMMSCPEAIDIKEKYKDENVVKIFKSLLKDPIHYIPIEYFEDNFNELSTIISDIFTFIEPHHCGFETINKISRKLRAFNYNTQDVKTTRLLLAYNFDDFMNDMVQLERISKEL